MSITDMEKAISEAEAERRRANTLSSKLAELLVGRLRTITDYHGRAALVKLKRELNSFNARYRTWEEER